MTLGTYNALMKSLRALRTDAELARFADTVRSKYAGDPQLGDVINSIRMARNGLRVAARQTAGTALNVSAR